MPRYGNRMIQNKKKHIFLSYVAIVCSYKQKKDNTVYNHNLIRELNVVIFIFFEQTQSDVM